MTEPDGDQIRAFLDVSVGHISNLALVSAAQDRLAERDLGNRETLMSIVATFAREALSSVGSETAPSDAAALYLYLQQVATA